MEIWNDKSIPLFDIKERMGSTDYIDIINWGEITEPIMKGIDKFKRHFFVIKMKIGNDLVMETYFQRYTYGKNWQSCGHATRTFMCTGGNELNIEQINLLKKVIKGETVKVEKNHRPWSIDDIGKNVYLYDEKIINAVKILEKYWLYYTYTPRYKLCKKLRYNKFLEDLQL